MSYEGGGISVSGATKKQAMVRLLLSLGDESVHGFYDQCAADAVARGDEMCSFEEFEKSLWECAR